MDKPYTGGCACGAIRYSIASEPFFSNDCQCRDCQRESGTGHGSHALGRVAILLEQSQVDSGIAQRFFQFLQLHAGLLYL